VKGYLIEGRRRLEAALDADSEPTAARAKALNAAADLGNGAGEAATARVHALEGLEINRAIGDKWGEADSLLVLGIALSGLGDFAAARDNMEEGARLFADLGDQRNLYEARRALSWAYHELGSVDQARQLLESVAADAGRLGDLQLQGRTLDSLAGYALDEGRIGDAERLLADAYRACRDSGDIYWMPMVVCRYARLLTKKEDPVTAARVLGSGQALLDGMGSAAGWLDRANEDVRAALIANIGEDAFGTAWLAGRTTTADDAVALAIAALVPHA
jgi:tetratricopeptide (TPR) repeat protein